MWWLLLLLLALSHKTPKNREGATVTREQMKDYFTSQLTDKAFLYIVDDEYRLPSLSEVHEFNEWWVKFCHTKKFKWVKDAFDCDNYSLLYTAFALLEGNFHTGITNSSSHSYNSVLAKNCKVQIIEPQPESLFVLSPQDAVKKDKKYRSAWVYYP